MKLLSKIRLSLSLGLLMFAVSPIQAQSLNLQHAPLFLNQSVEPNLAFSFDDSGSMDRGFMPEVRAEYGTAANGNGAELGRLREGGGDGNWFEPWATWSGYNSIYYDPNIDYGLPRRADGTPFPEVTLLNAPDDGYNTGSNMRNLTTNYRINWGCCNNDGPNRITNGTQDNGDNDGQYSFPFGATAFYHNYTGTASLTTPSGEPNTAAIADPTNYTAVNVSTLSAAEQTNFARWYSYYRTRLLVAKSGITLAMSGVNAPLRVVWQGLNRDQLGGADLIRTIEGNQRNDFWEYIEDDWEGSGGTPVRAATQRAGNLFARTGNNEANPYFDVTLSRELSCRQNYHVTVTDGAWKDAAGLAGNFDVTAFTLPDGTAFDPASPHTRVYANESANNVSGFADNAFAYWAADLRPDLTNNVPQFLTDTTTGVTGPIVASLPDDPFTNDEIYWNPANDPADWQHMVHFNIGLGVNGEIPLTDQSLTELRDGTLSWPSWGGENDGSVPGKIDDNWHAALNSRGQYFSASNPNELVTQLGQVLNSIVARSSSASAVAVSSGVVTTTAQSFRTRFNSGDWTGTVQSVSVQSIVDGTPVVDWDAGCNLTGGTCDSNPSQLFFLAPNARNIQITNNAGNLVDFTTSNLGALRTQTLDELNTAPDGTTDGRAADRVSFLRGERGEEVQNGGDFRNRNSVLGDIINSGAVFVQADSSSFNEALSFFQAGDPERAAQADYTTFIESVNASRPSRIYAGANDGMLHAFNGDTGVEEWAMIPTPVQENLAALTDPRYVKQSYVDDGPTVEDVFAGGRWRTYAAGGLRLGGQGYYGLDITDPSAGPVLLWEFTDEDDADLGYSYGEPHITRIPASDRWVVLLPSGYNSEENDDQVGSGEGAMFVVDATTGALVKKFDSSDFGQVVNGMGPATSADYGSDNITEAFFAGDLDGNIWRFDVEDENPAAWQVEKIFQPSVIGANPITAPPRLIPRSFDGALVVLVGTGQYLEPNDRVTTIPMQFFLGVFDRGISTSGSSVPGSYPATMGEMSGLSLALSGTDNRIFTSPPNLDPTIHEGWFIELNEPGERVINLASGRSSSQRVVFSTLIPAGDDPCLSGGSSFIISANVADGGPPTSFAPFDFTNDGVIDLADFSFAGGQGAGKRIEGLVVGVTPVVKPGGGEAVGLLGGDVDGPTPTIIEPAQDWARRGWRQLQLED